MSLCPHTLRAAAAALLLAAVAGCSAPPPPAAPAAPPEKGPELPSERAAIPPPAPTVPPESEMPADPVHRAIIGTAWRVKGMEARFLNARQVHVRGAQIEPYAPGGITAKYHYDGGKIGLNIMGQDFACVWDGTTLTINGLAADAVSADSGAPKP